MKLFQNVLIALIAGAGLAQSAHISLDSQFGPDTITLDTSTGIEWLDLGVTFLQSTDFVEEQMAPGGQYYGWRYASTTEFFDFAAPYLIPITGGYPPGYGCCVALETEPALDFVELMGFGRSTNVSPLSGLMQPSPGVNIIIVSLYLHPDDVAMSVDAVNYPSDGNGSGVYLVRTIPEASTAACVLAGLAFCELLRRLRRSPG